MVSAISYNRSSIGSTHNLLSHSISKWMNQKFSQLAIFNGFLNSQWNSLWVSRKFSICLACVEQRLNPKILDKASPSSFGWTNRLINCLFSPGFSNNWCSFAFARDHSWVQKAPPINCLSHVVRLFVGHLVSFEDQHHIIPNTNKHKKKEILWAHWYTV